MLQKLRLLNFRNFEEKLFEFSPDINIIVAPNAFGKTNVLEAIFLLSTGKSFRAKVESEMIRNGNDVGRVKTRINGDDSVDLEVVVSILSDRYSKKFLVNGVARRMVDFAGNVKSVLFGPWDMDLISGSPSGRRRFLDDVLTQADHEYRRSLISYEKGLTRRNRLLQRIRDERLSRTQLAFWDSLLIKEGTVLSQKREEFIDFVNQIDKTGDLDLSIEYDKSGVSEERFEKYSSQEVASGTTLVGPHRDDIVFKVKDQDLSSFGSRGEHRIAVLHLKLAELAFIEYKTKQRPVLLLDDIFSELDHKNRDVVMSVVSTTQTIITTADPHFIVDKVGVEKIEL